MDINKKARELANEIMGKQIICEGLEESIAENGLTSSYDDEDKVVDVIYHEGVNESDIKILSDILVNACTNNSAEYKGFHFNMV